MSNARKLQTEIDRVMKKIDEGVELFDEIWEKVYSAEQQNQKEKYEMDLKKEIKKLQRLRDQVKTWIGGSEVKDKEPLMEARRLIETKMEQFKICEKETKTKTYSKEGLAREEKLDPAEEAKLNTVTWIQEYIEQLQQLVEETDFEIEKLGKKKSNKSKIEELNHHIANHRFHISKLEGIIRLVNNDRLDVETVDSLKDDFDYYLDSFQEDEYMQAYDEEFFYEALGLDELDVVNVDHVTEAMTNAKKDETSSYTSSKGSKSKKASKTAVASVIPLTIGRATKKSGKKDEKAETPVKPAREPISATKSDPSPVIKSPVATAAPTPATPATPAAPSGASMAAILKRESELQEKERQKQLEQQRAAEQLRQQQEVQRRQQEAALLQQQQAQQEALQRQQDALRQKEAAAAAQNATSSLDKAIQPGLSSQKNPVDMLSSGLGNLGLGGMDRMENGLPQAAVNAGADATSPYLSALNDSFAMQPKGSDTERARSYTPQNPYPTPASYPATPSAIFDNPAVFEKLGTDCLFFIFYYSQGTYQQYLAARELKKQSWRFHKKYMTWFQRHEEPKVTTDEYEQGTYVYFDYETGWCTRIKQDFRFDYSFLEDSLQ